MDLKQRIQDDMKAAMRDRDSARLGTIRLLLAACKQREVDERIALDDAAVVAIVDRMIKQRRDSIAAFERGARADLVAKESAEIDVLQQYLPARLDAAALQAEVAALVAEIDARGPGDMGRAMAAAKSRLAGRADMAAVSAAIKHALAT